MFTLVLTHSFFSLEHDTAIRLAGGVGGLVELGGEERGGVFVARVPSRRLDLGGHLYKFRSRLRTSRFPDIYLNWDDRACSGKPKGGARVLI